MYLRTNSVLGRSIDLKARNVYYTGLARQRISGAICDVGQRASVADSGPSLIQRLLWHSRHLSCIA